MAQPNRFMNDVYPTYPDDESVKDVFLLAAGTTYNGIGDRHVLIGWWNTQQESPVTQIVQLTGQAGNYQYYAPFAQIQSLDGVHDGWTTFPLGQFSRAQRNTLLQLALQVRFSRTSTRNGCRVWTRDLLWAMVQAKLITQEIFTTIDGSVPLVQRVPEA